MNYYWELLNHGFRVMFNYFSHPYSSKWDNLLKEIIVKADEVIIKPSEYDKEVYTIDFHYKGKTYGVWVCNGFFCCWQPTSARWCTYRGFLTD